MNVFKPLERLLRRQFLAATDRPFAGDYVTSPRDALQLGATPRLLLLRQDRIGDVLVSVPLIRALRSKYPQAVIHMLFSRTNYGVRQAVLPWIDHAWRYDKTPASAIGLIRAFRRARYDVVVDLMDSPSTNSQLVAQWSRARARLGIRHERAGHYTVAVPLLDRERVHIVERLAQLLLPFGLDPAVVPLELEYRLTDAERARARARLAPTDRPRRLGVNISGSSLARFWGRDNFIALIKWFQETDSRFHVTVVGAPDYEPDLAAIAAATGAGRLPTLEFHEFAAVVHEFDLLLTPDTAVLHLGAAWKIPQVDLFHQPPGAPLPWYPYHSPYKALLHPDGVGHIPQGEVRAALRALVTEHFGPLPGAGGRV